MTKSKKSEGESVYLQDALKAVLKDSARQQAVVLESLETQHKDTNKRIDSLYDGLAKLTEKFSEFMGAMQVSLERQNNLEKNLERQEENQKDLGKDFKTYTKNTEIRFVEIEKHQSDLSNFDKTIEKERDRREKIKTAVISSLTVALLIAIFKIAAPLL